MSSGQKDFAKKMTLQEYKKYKAFINKLVNKLKDQALNEGVDTTLPEFETIIENIIKNYLSNKGLSYDEFKSIEQSVKDGKDLEESDVLFIPALAKKSKENRQKIAEDTKAEIESIKQEFLNSIGILKQNQELYVSDVEKIKSKIDSIDTLAKQALSNSQKIQTVIKTKEIIKELDKTQIDELAKDIRTLQLSHHDLLKDIIVSKQFMAGFDGKVSNKVKDLVAPEINRVVRSLQSQVYATNKKIDSLSSISPRVVSTTDNATSVINVGSTAQYQLTAVANDTEFSTTGTAVAGQKLTIRFKDAGVAKAITWNAIFRAVGVTLPTTTVASKTHYVGAIYNYTDTKWDVVAVGVEE